MTRAPVLIAGGGPAGSALALDVVSRGDAVAQNPLTLTDTNPLKH